MANFHAEPFDDTTLVKLAIYEQYLQEWLPVFINRKTNSSWNGTINVFDFFCGPGKDSEGKLGSPLLAIEIAKKFTGSLFSCKRQINFHFNDSKKTNIQHLRLALEDISLPDPIKCNLSQKPFKEIFPEYEPVMEGSANLLFIDQCGIKEVNPAVFSKLISIQNTDFLFFISSSFFRRFSGSAEFKKHIDTRQYVHADTPYTDIHRGIADMYRSMVPPHYTYYISPFSLKKKANIYGLIFGSRNLLGISKFLNICWKIDPVRGTANFDIDGDQLPTSGQNLRLFEENSKSKKLTKFQSDLERKLLLGELETDKDVFTYTLTNGFLPTAHAKEIVKRMKTEGTLTIEGGGLRLGPACIKEPRRIKLN